MNQTRPPVLASALALAALAAVVVLPAGTAAALPVPGIGPGAGGWSTFERAEPLRSAGTDTEEDTTAPEETAAAGTSSTGDTAGTDSEGAGEALTRDAELLAMELQIDWQDSTAVGLPYRGTLVDGVQLPVEGQNFFTWDAVHDRLDNPGDRRWATDDLILTVLAVLDAYRAANPDAPRVGISDLSRQRGGEFGTLYGGLGHRSHQNGLDVDIAYPRIDRLERGITRVDQVDLELSQDLVDAFVAAGAEYIFIGENTDLSGPSGIVMPWPHHDDHMHVRIRPS